MLGIVDTPRLPRNPDLCRCRFGVVYTYGTRSAAVRRWSRASIRAAAQFERCMGIADPQRAVHLPRRRQGQRGRNRYYRRWPPRRSRKRSITSSRVFTAVEPERNGRPRGAAGLIQFSPVRSSFHVCSGQTPYARGWFCRSFRR